MKREIVSRELKPINKLYLFNILNENRIFIMFSFLACAMPIVYSLFSSLIKPDGSQAVMAVGHLMPFLLAFMQLSFSISMIIFAKLRSLKIKDQETDNYIIISATIWMSILVGIIMVVFYILSSFFYIYFSCNRPNTQQTLNYGLDLIWTTTPFVLLYPFYLTTLFLVKRRDDKSSFFLLIFSFFVIFLLSFLFGILLDFKTIGLGVGVTIGLVISILVNILFIGMFYPIRVYSNKIVFEVNRKIWNVIFKESMTSISLSLFKGIAIIFLSFSIPNSINGFVPLSYQMSRVIWFNMMYFIPFIGIGIGEGIRYHYLSRHNKFDLNNCYLDHRWKNDFKVLYLTFGLTLVISIGCVFLVKPLAYIYSINDFTKFKDGKLPEIFGWGTPTTFPPSGELNFKYLKDLTLTPLPEFKPLIDNPNNNPIINIQNAAIRLENIKLFNNWVQAQINNNPNLIPEAKQNLELLGKWYEWLNNSTNADGVSILQYLETKYQFIFGTEIKNILAGKKPSDGFMLALKESLSYYEYLWLYSSTTPVVTESFISLRPLLDYNNVITSSNGNIIAALANNSLSSVLTSLYLTINTFDAKAMIYVCTFGISNSIWAILIQLNQRNKEGKGISYWFMCLVYALCIGFLVTFGALFGVVFKDQLGNSNPFQYLDAWTFPLVVISYAALIVLTIMLYISYKKVKRERIMNGGL